MSSESNTYSPSLKPHRSSDVHVTTINRSQSSMYATSLPPPKTTSFHIREDCWPEDATFTLIKAWGDNFLQLNRGNLRQKHWQHVADAVNSRHANAKKNRRTDVQCKNRLDTLKKRYKLEKTKTALNSNYVSSWPFFEPLDSLIGTLFKPSSHTPTPIPLRKRIPERSSMLALPPPPSSVPVGPRSKRRPPPLTDSSFSRRNFSVIAAAAAAAAADGASSDSDISWSTAVANVNGNGARRLRLEKEDGDPYQQLAEAIGRFAEVYERVEEAKQRQMVELEKQRMQFTKDLELQRMKLLMESQLHFEKLQRSKTNSGPDFCASDDDGDRFSDSFN